MSILAHRAHLAQSYSSLIFSAFNIYNCSWFNLKNEVYRTFLCYTHWVRKERNREFLFLDLSTDFISRVVLPVMAAIAARKKVISIGHFSLSVCLQSLNLFLLDQIKSNSIYWFYILIILKIREIQDRAKCARWAKILKITQPDNQLCSLICFLVFAFSHQNIFLSH